MRLKTRPYKKNKKIKKKVLTKKTQCAIIST